MGAIVGVHDRFGEPRAALAKRVSGGGKPDSPNEAAFPAGCPTVREIACVAKSDTILAWYRKLIARKFDGAKHGQNPGWPRVDEGLEALIVRMPGEHSGLGYDRIIGALANKGLHGFRSNRGQDSPPSRPRSWAPTQPDDVLIQVLAGSSNDAVTLGIRRLCPLSHRSGPPLKDHGCDNSLVDWKPAETTNDSVTMAADRGDL
jgi:hypothetical protein